MIFSCSAQERTVTFKVDMSTAQDIGKIGIRGNTAPLNWKEDYVLTDSNQDGIYETTLSFKTSNNNLRFKFSNNEVLELDGDYNRIVWFKDEPSTELFEFNEFKYYDKEKLATLIYSKAQIKEDVAVLKEIIQYVHPNVYKYRDSVELQNDFAVLELEMLMEPTLLNAYKAVSKFTSNIKCSHTFTNPWNQPTILDRAMFYQPDKIPFTFNRIGKKLFIDKSASENRDLEKGLEILMINDVPSQVVMTKLAQHVTSDGSNYEKKLERLIVDGTEKFALFDIFYPLEFGSTNTFKLLLKNNITENIFETSVQAISKTNRTALLKTRYGKIETSLRDGWKFKILNKEAALLTIKSFAVQRNEFDWKKVLDAAFNELNKKDIPNLIIDIRGNEGGQGEVGEYILEKIIQSPFEAPEMVSSVRYKVIPEKFEKYMSTWDKFPYDFTNKIAKEENGRYQLKSKYSLAAKTYKPQKNGYKGQVYLITDASNSSATHLMAMYAKKMPEVTIIGQETGGNQKGTNGSFIFFLRLPNTRIVVDIPAIGMQVPVKSGEVYDGGVKPDIIVKKTANDFVNNVDTELETVLGIIEAK